MPVITISNQYGAGGPELASEISKRLGLDCYDKEIIHKVALAINVPASDVADFEPEQHSKLTTFLSSIFDLDNLQRQAKVEESSQAAESKYDDRDRIPYQYHVDGWIDHSIYKDMIVKVITALGKKGNVVIIGRGGQMILKDMPGVTHLRLVSDIADRVKRVGDKKGLTGARAEEYVTTLDARSRDYLKFYFDCNPDQATLYNMVLNTSKVPVAKCADLVEQLLK